LNPDEVLGGAEEQAAGRRRRKRWQRPGQKLALPGRRVDSTVLLAPGTPWANNTGGRLTAPPIAQSGINDAKLWENRRMMILRPAGICL
jgi:hypothetical protein